MSVVKLLSFYVSEKAEEKLTSVIKKLFMTDVNFLKVVYFQQYFFYLKKYFMLNIY